MTDLTTPELQQAQTVVFAQIGKCILNLQLYEQALKNLLPHFELTSYGPTVEQQRDQLAKKTLGTLISLLLEKTSPFDEEQDTVPAGLEQVAMRARFRIPVLAEEAERIRRELADLLDKRNFLVHHFRSEYSLKDKDGCTLATNYLNGLNDQVKSAIKQVNQIAEQIDSSRALLGSLMSSEEILREIEEMLSGAGEA